MHFSVIIPVYNVEKYIKQCLDSCLNQTEKSIEFICINDGSTDNSLSILKEYQKTDSRIKIINQNNQGQGIARNNAINIAQGEYIVFVDPDDWLKLNALEKIYNKFNETNADVICFDYICYNEKSKKIEKNSLKNILYEKYNLDFSNNKTYSSSDIYQLDLFPFNIVAWNKAYKRTFLIKNNIKFAPYKFIEDHYFAIKTILCAENIYYLEEYLYVYRIRLGSMTRKASYDVICAIDNITIIKDLLIEKGVYKKLKEKYELYLYNALIMAYDLIEIKYQKEFKTKLEKILTYEQYKTFLSKINGQYSFLEKIFSIKNRTLGYKKHKSITVFGLTFIF